MGDELQANAILLQEKPKIYVAVLSGRWLLQHTQVSLRIEDPKKGFNRLVREDRARQIAAAVLDQRRSFPNAIVLATKMSEIKFARGKLSLPSSIRFLIVDGQHRLRAEEFSDYDAPYACIIHTGLQEPDMARLFVEINENQRRVPSSLRWDLVRLIKPEHQTENLRAADLVYELAMQKDSPLFQRIDLTGENPKIELKQGSVAPAIRSLLGGRRAPLKTFGFDNQYEILTTYLAAIRSWDADGWADGTSAFHKNRVMRAAFRLLADLIDEEGKDALSITAADYLRYLKKISPESVDTVRIKKVQGTAGIKAIYEEMRLQVFGK